MRHIFINGTVSEVSDDFVDPRFDFLTEEQEAYLEAHPDAPAEEVRNLGQASQSISLEDKKAQVSDDIDIEAQAFKQELVTPELVLEIARKVSSVLLGIQPMSDGSEDGLSKFISSYEHIESEASRLHGLVEQATTVEEVEQAWESKDFSHE